MGRRREQDLEQALARALSAGISEGERRAFERVLFAAATDVLGADVDDVEDFIRDVGTRQAIPLITEAAAEAWPERYRVRLSPVLTAIMQSTTAGAAPVLGAFDLANPMIGEAFRDYTSKLGRDLSETTRDDAIRTIREGLGEGLPVPAVADRIRERLPEINRSRATLISRTELTRASNTASLLQAKESGVVSGKRWLATKDPRTREEHRRMDGETVGIDEVFSNGLQSPGEPNCRCTLQFVLSSEILGGAA